MQPSFNTITNTSSKIAIVTGAFRGIGRSVAKQLAQDGFAVVLNYAGNSAQAEETVDEIKAAGGQGIAVPASRQGSFHAFANELVVEIAV